jgi:hypothetical protein
VTEVVVLAAPGRDAAHARCFPSIEASDIGKSYLVSMHPEGRTPNEHWRATHEIAARAKSEFVLVLEDDVLVNRHILANIESWRWKHSGEFGAGWVYNPGGYSTNKDTWYRGAKPWAMTPGVLYRTATLPKLIDIAWAKMSQVKDPLPWDSAIAFAAESGGMRIRVHFPSLVEHMNDVPSKVGNSSKSSMRTSRGTFRSDWLRPIDDTNGIFDRFGRRVDPNQR